MISLNSIPNEKIMNWTKLKASADDKLTLSQKANFGFFQTERVCKQQFFIK